MSDGVLRCFFFERELGWLLISGAVLRCVFLQEF